MKKKILSLFVAISLAITSLTLISCDLSNIENGEVNYKIYENSENYSVGNCQVNYDEFDKIDVDWVVGDIVVKKSENAYVSIKENVTEDTEGTDAYKMRYIIEDRVLKVKFWQSGYVSKAKAEDKKLTVELPATVNTDISIYSISSNIICEGELRSDLLDIETISGKIDIEGVNSDKLTIASLSGNISVLSLKANEVSAGNISGNVNLNIKSLKDLEVSTVSGNVDLKLNDVVATVNFDTVSGKLTAKESDNVSSNEPAEIFVKTVSGNLTIN